jgi:NAD(P)-dependent dehydrogenase (short-subunit alcohol dehydrogenase family)
MRATKRRALVTGANRGLGLGLCAALAADGDAVLAVCRRTSPELDALGVTVVDGVDITEESAVSRIGEAIGDEPVDLVVANAVSNRALNIKRADDLDLGLFEEDVRVTVVGTVRTVLTALPSMGAGSRIVLVSTGAAAPGPPTGSFGYRITKGAVNQFARALAPDVRERGIIVAAVCPGTTNTDLLRASYEAGIFTRVRPDDARSPIDSARRLLATAEAVPLESSGSFWSSTGEMYLDPDGRSPAVTVTA